MLALHSSRSATCIIASLSALSLILAFIAQYGFNMHPCELCLWQRVPFYVVVGMGILALFTKNLPNAPALSKILLALMVLSLLVNVAIAAFHTGVEQGWWQGLSSCGDPLSGSAIGSATDKIDDIRAQIFNAPVIRCDKPAIEFFGFLTMASANVFFSLLLAGIGLRAMVRKS